MFNVFICLIFSSCLQTHDLKKDFKRLENFNPDTIYIEKNAHRIINASLRCGEYTFQQAESKVDQNEKVSLLKKAGRYYTYAADGNIKFYTNIAANPVGFLVDPMAMYLKTYIDYQLLTVPTSSTLIDACLFKNSYQRLQTAIQNQLFYLSPELHQSLESMLIQGLRETGSPILLSTILENNLLHNTDYLSSLWDGMQTWDKQCFAQNMQILSQHSLDFLRDTTILEDPLMKIIFFKTCIEKEFNPFTLESDVHAGQALRSQILPILTSYVHNTILDEYSTQLIKETLHRLKVSSIQHTFNTGTVSQIADLLLKYFKNKTDVNKITQNHQIITPLLQKYLHKECNTFITNHAHLMIELIKKDDKSADSLLPYVDLCAPVSKQLMGQKSPLPKAPSVLGTLLALEQTKENKNWENLNFIIPSLISHLAELSFDDLQNHLDYFTKVGQEPMNHMDDLLVNSFLAHYYTFVTHRALAEKKTIPVKELISYHLTARDYAEACCQTDVGVQQLIVNKEACAIFPINGLMLGIIDQNSKLLTIHGKEIAHTLAKNPESILYWNDILARAFEQLQEQHSAAFNSYLQNSTECTDNAYAALINVLAFLYHSEQQRAKNKNDIVHNIVLKHFLNEFATQMHQSTELTADMLYNVVRETYRRFGHKELLCIFRDHAPDIGDFAIAVATYIGNQKTADLQQKIEAFDYLESNGILEKLKINENLPVAAVVLADIEAGLCFTNRSSRSAESFQKTQIKNINNLKKYITLIKENSSENDEETKQVINEKVKKLEESFIAEKLLYDIEFNHSEAFNTIQSLTNKTGIDGSIVDRDIILHAIMNRKENDPKGFDQFYTYCIQKSLEDKQYKEAASVLTSLAIKEAGAFQACLSNLKTNYNQLLAECLFYHLIARKASAKEKQQFIECIEEKIPELKESFATMDTPRQENLISFLHRISERYACPSVELVAFEMQKSLSHQLLNKRPDDSIRRLIKQIECQIPTATKFPDDYAEEFNFLHTLLDKYRACNYFIQAIKYMPKELEGLYKSLYGQILMLATRIHYQGFMVQGSPFDKLNLQLKLARGLIETGLKGSDNNDTSYNVLNALDGLELNIAFMHNPEQCIQDLIKDLNSFYNEFDFSTAIKKIVTKIDASFPTGTLQECVQFLEKKSQSPEEQMLFVYLLYTLAKKSNDREIKTNYLKKIIDLTIQEPVTLLTTEPIITILEGKMLPEFKDEKKANALHEQINNALFAKYHKAFKDKKEWATVYPKLNAASQSGFTRIGYLLALIYKNSNRLDESLMHARSALKLETNFKEHKPSAYSEKIEHQLIQLIAQLQKKMKHH